MFQRCGIHPGFSILTAALLIAFASCTTPNSAATPVRSPVPGATSAEAIPAITPRIPESTPGAAILIEFHRSGGIAGLRDRLTIYANGRARLVRASTSCEFDLDIATVDQLQNLFDQAEFSKLGAKYFPSRKGSDLFEYELTYRDHTVGTMDTAVPESLWPILDLLNQIVENCGNP